MSLLELAHNAPVQQIRFERWRAHNIDAAIWRLDLLDAAGSGNKLFKLAENLQSARALGYSRILSFGGAFSNHIHALAIAGRKAGLETIGVIRGEAAAATNPTLRDAVAAGMQLYFVDRNEYRALTQNTLDYKALSAELETRFGPCYIVPEGGANRLGVEGCRVLGEVLRERISNETTIVLPTATGSTLAGVVAGLNNYAKTIGIAVLKGGNFIAPQIIEHLREAHAAHCTAWQVELDYHCGGYARVPESLSRFVAQFCEQTGVAIEPVYTGKMIYAIDQMIDQGRFREGTQILAVHTGGMQGARGLLAA